MAKRAKKREEDVEAYRHDKVHMSLKQIEKIGHKVRAESRNMRKQAKGTTVMSREEVVSILKKELPNLKDRYGVEKILLYGSFVKRIQKKKSDIDILVELRKPLGLEFVSLADRLEKILGRKVDVATYDHYKRSFHNPRYKHIAEDIKKSLIYV